MMLWMIPRKQRKLTSEEVTVHQCLFYHAQHTLKTQEIAIFTRLPVSEVTAAVQELRKRKLLPRQYYYS